MDRNFFALVPGDSIALRIFRNGHPVGTRRIVIPTKYQPPLSTEEVKLLMDADDDFVLPGFAYPDRVPFVRTIGKVTTDLTHYRNTGGPSGPNGPHVSSQCMAKGYASPGYALGNASRANPSAVLETSNGENVMTIDYAKTEVGDILEVTGAGAPGRRFRDRFHLVSPDVRSL